MIDDTSAAESAMRVFLVDDEELFRETLAKLLRRCGTDVATAASGEEARRAEACDFLLKPVGPDQLVQVIMAAAGPPPAVEPGP